MLNTKETEEIGGIVEEMKRSGWGVRRYPNLKRIAHITAEKMKFSSGTKVLIWKRRIAFMLYKVKVNNAL